MPPRVFLFFFFSIFLIVGCTVTYTMGVRPLLKVMKARNWVEVPCLIDHSEVRRHRGSDSTTYSVHIRYTYEFGGAEYTNDRYDFLGGSSSGYASKQRVDPMNPADSVFRRELSSTFLFGMIPLVFAIVGAGGLWFVVFGKTWRKSKGVDGAAEKWMPKVEAARDNTGESEYLPPRAMLSQEGVLLKGGPSPVAKFIGSLIGALIWNGVVVFLATQMIRESRSGIPMGLIFITLIFGLFGLAILGFAVYSFLALANPRPRVRISSLSAPLGGNLKLSWTLSGRVNNIRVFRVELRCREEATYRRGTSTTTDRNPFFNMILFETSHPAEIMAGERTFTIPADAMHSFESSNNKIIWSVGLHGEIEKWPDIKEDYKISVAPIPAGKGASL
jgi:hypothetical protein